MREPKSLLDVVWPERVCVTVPEVELLPTDTPGMELTKPYYRHAVCPALVGIVQRYSSGQNKVYVSLSCNDRATERTCY